jgi:predicted TIM-barrel fold metal-dependent hydrolase
MNAEASKAWDPRGGPDPDTKAPRFNLPAGACDCHVHVYGPAARFPFQPSHAERSFEAPKDALETMHRKIGMDRCVIVHVPAHGTDLAVTLDAMASSDRQVRAVALVNNEITDNRLEELHGAGVRGIRYSPTLDGGPLNHAAVRRMADRIAPLGWHILFHFKDNGILPYADLLKGLPIPCVLDHFGGSDPATGGADQDSFRIVSELLQSDNGWIKISAIEKVSHQPYPFADAAAIAAALVEIASDRVLWGSDWPHPSVGPQGPTNDGDLVDLIPTYVSDPAIQQKLLVQNPDRLYGFD